MDKYIEQLVRLRKQLVDLGATANNNFHILLALEGLKGHECHDHFSTHFNAKTLTWEVFLRKLSSYAAEEQDDRTHAPGKKTAPKHPYHKYCGRHHAGGDDKC